MERKIIIFGAAVVAVAVVVWAVVRLGNRPAEQRRTDLPAANVFDSQDRDETGDDEPIQVVADNLEIPWELAFLPDGSLLVTERPGYLVRITTGGRRRITVADVEPRGEGGLLGLALHPSFADNNLLYLYHTVTKEGRLINRVDRYRFDMEANQLDDRSTIIDNIPAAANHDGGKIAFGPDGYLYVSTGDAEQPELAQDTDSLAGKILRVTADGDAAPDNPFGNLVYSYGHRNVQGLAWDGSGQLFATEHGPSGLNSGHDEINLIKKGANYGWPRFRGAESDDSTVAPVADSGANETWAPAGAVVVGNRLYFAGLRGETLYFAQIHGEQLGNIERALRREYGRLRGLLLADGWIYITTSNRDGRGDAIPVDDRIIRFRTNYFD